MVRPKHSVATQAKKAQLKSELCESRILFGRLIWPAWRLQRRIELCVSSKLQSIRPVLQRSLTVSHGQAALQQQKSATS